MLPRRAPRALRTCTRWLAACGLAAALPAAWAQALLTIVDGDATLTDGARRYAAAPGVKLAPATLVDTGPGATVVRIEWPDRSVVDLGPATRVMLQPPGWPQRDGRPPLLYVLKGWVKLTSAEQQPLGGVVTPTIELLPVTGSAVVSVGKPADTAFAESAPLEVIERAGSKRLGVAAGALYAGSGRVEPRPTAAWLGTVPRAFRDPLPRRFDALKDRAVTASALPAPPYVALADWLAAEPGVRRPFPRRFEALAQDAAFRRELQAHLSAHPEWGVVLFPPERKP